jgi:hypothetical protein
MVPGLLQQAFQRFEIEAEGEELEAEDVDVIDEEPPS